LPKNHLANVGWSGSGLQPIDAGEFIIQHIISRSHLKNAKRKKFCLLINLFFRYKMKSKRWKILN